MAVSFRPQTLPLSIRRKSHFPTPLLFLSGALLAAAAAAAAAGLPTNDSTTRTRE